MFKNQLLHCAETLGGQCAFVIRNFNTGEAFAHNENLVVPSASLIKVPVMIEIMRQIKLGKISPNRRLYIAPEEKTAYSVLEFLNSDNTYTILDLVKLMNIYSDNTAANLLIDLAGMGNVNNLIQGLGLRDTKLQRKMIDPEARKAGKENYTTAGDMAALMVRLYGGTIIDQEYSEMILDIMKGQVDESMMRVDLPDEMIIARKSGELESLNHEMAIVYGNQCDYLYVFFVWGTATNNQSREILQKTSKIVFDYFDK